MSDAVGFWRKKALAAQAEADQYRRLCERQAEDIASLEAQVATLEERCKRATADHQKALEEIRLLKQQLGKFLTEGHDQRQRIEMLEQGLSHAGEQLTNALRRQYGQSSERITVDQTILPEVLEQLAEEFQLDEDDLAILRGEQAAPGDQLSCPGDSEEAAITKTAPKKRKRPAKAGGRNPLPEHLPRIDKVYNPPADHPDLAGAVSFDTIDQVAIERLDKINDPFHVTRFLCSVVRIVDTHGNVRQETIVPPSVIGNGQATDAFIIDTAIDRTADHLPAYRQQQRAARSDLTLARSKLTRWHMRLAEHLQPVASAILQELLQEPVVGIDDSVNRLLDPGRGRCKQGRVWVVTGNAGAFYQASETREAKWIEAILADYSGHVMGDAYSGHKGLLARPSITALFCWAHVRRKFFESSDKRKNIMLNLIGELYRIEADVADRPPDERRTERQRRSRPILATIEDQLERWSADDSVLPKSGFGKAINYTRKLWDGLIRYADSGIAPIDNNHTERHLRRVALHRKNSLFSASTKGAEAYATLLTLVESALHWEFEPGRYLNWASESLHFHRRQPHELTPAAYARQLREAGTMSS